MTRNILIELKMPTELEQFRLPEQLHARLQLYLDRQDRGEALTSEERQEAEELVQLSELLSLLKLRARRTWKQAEAE